MHINFQRMIHFLATNKLQSVERKGKHGKHGKHLGRQRHVKSLVASVLRLTLVRSCQFKDVTCQVRRSFRLGEQGGGELLQSVLLG